MTQADDLKQEKDFESWMKARKEAENTDPHGVSKGVINIKYRPTICNTCNKLLCISYLQEGHICTEPSFHVICDDCWMKMIKDVVAKP